jgi:hypothetical protein
MNALPLRIVPIGSAMNNFESERLWDEYNSILLFMTIKGKENIAAVQKHVFFLIFQVISFIMPMSCLDIQYTSHHIMRCPASVFD